MKKFARAKRLDELREAVTKAGATLDTSKYDHGQSDFVLVTGTFAGVPVEVAYSVFNGRFYGQKDDGTGFSSDSTALDGEPWFSALLELVYVEAKEG